MIDLKRYSRLEFDNVIAYYLVSLLSFVQYKNTGQEVLSKSDLSELLHSGDPFLVAFRNRDLPRLSRVTSEIGTKKMPLSQVKKLQKVLSSFNETLKSIDVRDPDDGWNFFGSGLDVLLDRMESLLEEPVVDLQFTVNPGTPEPWKVRQLFGYFNRRSKSPASLYSTC